MEIIADGGSRIERPTQKVSSNEEDQTTAAGEGNTSVGSYRVTGVFHCFAFGRSIDRDVSRCKMTLLLLPLRDTTAAALKRGAITHVFRRDLGGGDAPWRRS